ncbi:dihydropteroate synthase [Akkermansiaceae bacterium]|nr:dihydropteroate synthase [Akkermansiaceae bacterium]MDB4538101.1 dihydropteroate synthase [Akkermansiaceae bacterium]
MMGIVNVTPDSFSDGGRYDSLEESVFGGLAMVDEGADILDVGGESTRPGAKPVSLEEELSRVIPVISGLAERSSAAISIDTCKPEVAARAVEAGASIVNDVTGLSNPRMLEFCAESDCGVVVMHMKGTPETMQSQADYNDVVQEMQEFFYERYETLICAGINKERIVFDPGIGFGKSLKHNLALIDQLGDLIVEGRPVLIGLSRKSFIGALLEASDLALREAPTVALTALCRVRGAMIHRVHSVKGNFDALRMIEAIG